MILAKVVEFASLALFVAAAGTEATTTLIPQGALLQFGALGLVAYMIAQKYRQDVKIATVMDRKDGEVLAAHERANDLASGFTEAVNNLSRTLGQRPCMADCQKPENINRKDTSK